MGSLGALQALIARHARNAAMEEQLPSLWLRMISATTEPTCITSAPALTVVAQGHKRTILGSRVLDYGTGEMLVSSLAMPVTAQITAASPRVPFLGVGILVRRDIVVDLLAGTGAPASSAPPPAMQVGQASAELLDAFERYLRLLDSPRDIAALGAGIEREIIWRGLQCGAGATLRNLAGWRGRSLPIDRAIASIRRRSREPLNIPELARQVGMSLSTFNRHFRAVTSMSPLQFQKRLRLQEARARLLTEPANVAAAAFAVGYESPSQFSREYRRLFGMPPSQDAARPPQTVTEV